MKYIMTKQEKKRYITILTYYFDYFLCNSTHGLTTPKDW